MELRAYDYADSEIEEEPTAMNVDRRQNVRTPTQNRGRISPAPGKETGDNPPQKEDSNPIRLTSNLKFLQTQLESLPGNYEEYISQEGYHHAPPQNLYSQNVYPHNSYSEQSQYSQPPQNEKYFPYTRDEHYLSYTQNPQYPPYSQDHQDYPYYSNHYENEKYMMQPYEEEITEDTKNKILAIMEEFKQDMANMREEWRQERIQRTSSLEQETQASIRNLEDQMAQVAKYMTSENNCIIEDVDNACVEMPSDEIGVKEHDNFCDEPYDDSFDHNCGDAHIENVVGNVDCVVDNVHANLLENVGDINAKRDDDICDNSSNACKNATYDLHNNALKCGNDFWVDNEVNFLNPYDFNDSDSFDSSDDDDGNCVDTCENNSFNSNDDNDGLESFTFDDNSLINEHVEKGETDGDLRDVLLSSEKEEEKENVTIEKENEEENFENEKVLFEEVHCKIIEEEEEKTRDESVKEEVEEKVRNDEKEFGVVWGCEGGALL
nr:hypothetical protein Iba_chr01bCG8030 [Ipomoea batatas]